MKGRDYIIDNGTANSERSRIGIAQNDKRDLRRLAEVCFALLLTVAFGFVSIYYYNYWNIGMRTFDFYGFACFLTPIAGALLITTSFLLDWGLHKAGIRGRRFFLAYMLAMAVAFTVALILFFNEYPADTLRRIELTKTGQALTSLLL